MLAIFYKVAIGSGIAPLVIFMGVGAMTDFGPLLANPRTLLLGAAAQFGIFATVLGALTLNYFGIISFTLPQAAAIGIIGGADGPTAIYLSGKLAPELLGAIAVAAYSYMALVPLIQPPIMKALTSEKERKIRMVQLRTVSKREKILFPAVLLLLVALLLPDAAPLLGMFCFGNLMRESGVVERLSDTVQNGLINIVTIFLGLSVGAKLVADKFLQPQTLGILVLGVIAFCVGTAGGGADGETAEPVQPEQNQPADWLGRGVGGADGGQGVKQGGSGVGRAELPADARDGPERGGGDWLGDCRRGDAQVRAGDVNRYLSRRRRLTRLVRATRLHGPVARSAQRHREISYKEALMNETITLRPESRASTKDVIIDYMLASVDEVEQLQPALNLLAQPSVARGGHDFFVHCYEAGTQNKAAETEPALPDAVFRDSTPWMQRSGLLCAAAGRLNALGQPLTHNRLCDLAGQYCASVADADAETRSGFYTVRSISLPVYRRLLRDKHPSGICLQQALLHLLAWKSDSPWARQQAQRLLWQGGVLGDKGEFALMTLDDELRERQFAWPDLRSLLAITGFLATFPAGPLFAD